MCGFKLMSGIQICNLMLNIWYIGRDIAVYSKLVCQLKNVPLLGYFAPTLCSADNIFCGSYIDRWYINESTFDSYGYVSILCNYNLYINKIWQWLPNTSNPILYIFWHFSICNFVCNYGDIGMLILIWHV